MRNVALKGDSLQGIHPSLVPVVITGYIGTGSPNVYINGIQAARVGDTTYEWCALHDILPVYGKVIMGSSKVFINGMPAAYALETIQPHAGTANLTGGGSTSVFIE
jgi:uncharacterized Zn-binding protein involved in type VI secretion